MAEKDDGTIKEYWPDGSLKSQKPKGEDKASAVAVEESMKKTDLGAKGKAGTGMPKQADYPTTAAWSEAMRKWRTERDADPEVSGQKKAIKNLRDSGGGSK